jgi:hypothetical protein
LNAYSTWCYSIASPVSSFYYFFVKEAREPSSSLSLQRRENIKLALFWMGVAICLDCNSTTITSNSSGVHFMLAVILVPRSFVLGFEEAVEPLLLWLPAVTAVGGLLLVDLGVWVVHMFLFFVMVTELLLMLLGQWQI